MAVARPNRPSVLCNPCGHESVTDRVHLWIAEYLVELLGVVLPARSQHQLRMSIVRSCVEAVVTGPVGEELRCEVAIEHILRRTGPFGVFCRRQERLPERPLMSILHPSHQIREDLPVENHVVLRSTVWVDRTPLGEQPGCRDDRGMAVGIVCRRVSRRHCSGYPSAGQDLPSLSTNTTPSTNA